MVIEIDLDKKVDTFVNGQDYYVINVRKCRIPTLKEVFEMADYKEKIDKKGYYDIL